jgi:hypothetical protein
MGATFASEKKFGNQVTTLKSSYELLEEEIIDFKDIEQGTARNRSALVLDFRTAYTGWQGFVKTWKLVKLPEKKTRTISKKQATFMKRQAAAKQAADLVDKEKRDAEREAAKGEGDTGRRPRPKVYTEAQIDQFRKEGELLAQPEVQSKVDAAVAAALNQSQTITIGEHESRMDAERAKPKTFTEEDMRRAVVDAKAQGAQLEEIIKLKAQLETQETNNRVCPHTRMHTLCTYP